MTLIIRRGRASVARSRILAVPRRRRRPARPLRTRWPTSGAPDSRPQRLRRAAGGPRPARAAVRDRLADRRRPGLEVLDQVHPRVESGHQPDRRQPGGATCAPAIPAPLGRVLAAADRGSRGSPPPCPTADAAGRPTRPPRSPRPRRSRLSQRPTTSITPSHFAPPSAGRGRQLAGARGLPRDISTSACGVHPGVVDPVAGNSAAGRDRRACRTTPTTGSIRNGHALSAPRQHHSTRR